MRGVQPQKICSVVVELYESYRPTNMFRLGFKRTHVGTCWDANARQLRQLSRSSITFAASAPKQRDGKKKIKLGIKKKAAAPSKPKRSGMTHLKFKDAVRALNFEKNAADISGLGIKPLSFDALKSQDSSVVKYDQYALQTLRALDSFKKYQHHELFSEPVSMVNSNTLEISKFLENFDSSSKNNRLCLIGSKGIGKSTLLSQAKALALSKFQKDVVLLHLDHTEKIVEGSSDYIFNNRLGKYQQPMFTKRWIMKLREANKEVFEKMPLTRDVSFTSKKTEYNLKKNENSLYDFVLLNHDFGKVGPSTAFSFFIEELVAHSKNIPVLVTIDNFNVITSEPLTAYYHPNFTPIHVSEFEIGDFILNLASGKLSFSKGGVLLSESKDVADRHTLSVGLGITEYNPYWKVDECDVSIAENLLDNGGVAPLKLKELSKAQTRTLMSFWKDVNVLQNRDYPLQEVFKSFEQIASEEVAKAAGANVEDHEFDPEVHFEKIVNHNFVRSAGNPGHLLKSVALSY